MRFQFFRPFRVPLSPGDYLIAAVFGVVLIAGAFWLLTETSLSFTTEVPARGGTYAEALIGTPRFINPVLAISDVDRDMVQLVFSGLMQRIPNGDIVPDVAESVVLSDDRRTYTFTIREDARFHDGTPVRASDVAFTVSLAQSPILKSPKRANWEGVVVEVLDERTVAFTLKEPYAPFIENARLGILPEHLWQDVTLEETPFSKLNIEPVGSGPYAFSKLTTNSGGIPATLTLRAFTEGSRVPYISELSFSFYGDSEAQAAALAANPNFAAHSVLPSSEEQVAHEAVLGRVFGVFFNQNQNNVFADRTVRAALDGALDKKYIVSTLIGGYGSELSGPLPPLGLHGDALEPFEERLADSVELLEKAGWKKGEDGIWAKTEKKATTRLAFTLRTGNAPELRGAAELVRDAWRTFGADVTLELFDASDLQQDVIRPRKYDALLFGEVVGRDADLFAFWDSSQRNDPGLNVALYTNSSVDALLRAARSTNNPIERLDATMEAAKIISDETAAVFLYSPHFVFVTPRTIRGITLTSIVTPADRFLAIDEWYQKTERVWPIFQ